MKWWDWMPWSKATLRTHPGSWLAAFHGHPAEAEHGRWGEGAERCQLLSGPLGRCCLSRKAQETVWCPEPLPPPWGHPDRATVAPGVWCPELDRFSGASAGPLGKWRFSHNSRQLLKELIFYPVLSLKSWLCLPPVASRLPPCLPVASLHLPLVALSSWSTVQCTRSSSCTSLSCSPRAGSSFKAVV